VIPFTPQDLFARNWAAQSASFAPHAPFIGSFHPQIPQGLISSYATTNPWIGSGLGNAFGAGYGNAFTGGFGGGFGTTIGGSINPLALAALQSGLVSPYAGWQNTGLPLNAYAAGGIQDLSPFTLGARQAYLPGFYPTNFLAAGQAGLLPGSPFVGGGFTPAFAS
jgi:hypothetical protein